VWFSSSLETYIFSRADGVFPISFGLCRCATGTAAVTRTQRVPVGTIATARASGDAGNGVASSFTFKLVLPTEVRGP
jgi:hypothetical protein